MIDNINKNLSSVILAYIQMNSITINRMYLSQIEVTNIHIL